MKLAEQHEEQTLGKTHLVEAQTQTPAGKHQNDVVSTSMRRDHVASTLIRRHFNVVCPLGPLLPNLTQISPVISKHSELI